MNKIRELLVSETQPELAVGSQSFVDMLRVKMGAMPRGKPDSAAMQEDMRGYGQKMSGNMLEWEVFSPGDF